MPRARVQPGIELAYETLGPPDGAPIVLIQGFASALPSWSDDFCRLLTDRGHRVIRFDNRDIGRSTVVRESGVPRLRSMMEDVAQDRPVKPPYDLSDLARDTAGLIDALGLESAHVVGMSLGGMIAQTVAIEHPARVRTLTCIMSTTSARDLPGPTPEAAVAVYARIPDEREAWIERRVELIRVLAGNALPSEEGRVRHEAEQSFDRGWHPGGVARQLAVILTAPDRRAALELVRVPALVIHGTEDPLLRFACGQDIAEHLPNARFLPIEGMGHFLPRSAFETTAEAIHRLIT